MPALPFPSVTEALAWLDEHIDFESKMPSRRALPTLDRMRQLMTVLGDPESACPAIHLTGTNGKGSTAAMVSSILGVSGLGVGTYTSPNLSSVNERIARNGEAIGDDEFCEVLSTLAALEPTLDERPTRFELLTAAALRWFADVAVDVMVIEVGLGGTWDSTNVVDGDVAVVTNVSFDHTDVLGPTLEGIARDKAGIIKPGSRVIIGDGHPELVDVIRQVAEVAGALEVWVRGEEFETTSNIIAVGGRLIDVRTPTRSYEELLVPLHGAHQGENASSAVAAVDAFLGSGVSADLVGDGLAAVRVPGRLEVLGRRPLTVVDGAHNVAGMAALAAAVRDEFAVPGPIVAVVGMLGGRDPSAMLAALAPSGVSTVVACEPRSPRALPAELVAQAAASLGLGEIAATGIPDALAQARDLVGLEGLLLVAGSLYVVADARELLLRDADLV